MMPVFLPCLFASPIGVMTRKAIAPLAVLMALVGCGRTDRIVTSSIQSDDYRVRHPIVLAEAKTTIDVFPVTGAGHIDKLTAKQIIAFGGQYRDTGHGAISVLLPNGPGNGDRRIIVADIKRALSLAGARGPVEVMPYPIADPSLAAPVRLSFVGLKAKVADQCGQWPNDLGSGSSVEGWQNKSYWNFGCATQTMIAAQASDPRDLATPRGEEPPDTTIRMRGIDAIRKGSDPTTPWVVKNSSIGSVGSN